MPLEGGEVKSPWGSWLNPPVVEQLAKWATAIGCETEPKVVSENDGLRKVEYPSKTSGPNLHRRSRTSLAGWQSCSS